MTPYGNQHRYVVCQLNSTKHFKATSRYRRSSRRVANKIRRAQDKALTRQIED